MSWALGGLIFLGGLVGTTLLADLLSEEIHGWLDLAPQGLLRLAARQLDPVQRETIYQDEWLPELTYILREAGSRPITRLVRGMAFATGIVVSARRIARRLDRGRATLPASTTNVSADADCQTWRANVYAPGSLELHTFVGKEEADFDWLPLGNDADREFVSAVISHVQNWRGRPMTWPPPDQSSN